MYSVPASTATRAEALVALTLRLVVYGSRALDGARKTTTRSERARHRLGTGCSTFLARMLEAEASSLFLHIERTPSVPNPQYVFGGLIVFNLLKQLPA